MWHMRAWNFHETGKALTLLRGCDSSKKENVAMASKIYTIWLCDRPFFVGMNCEFLHFRNFVSFHQFLNNAAIFWKWLLVMDKLTDFHKCFWIFMDKLRNCTFDKFLKRLWKTSLFEFFYSRSIYLSIVWATMFSWFLICFVKVFKKPSASCFIFSGLHKPKKHQVYYSWIIRAVVTMSTLSVGTKSRIQNPFKVSFHAVLWTTQIWIRAKYIT